MRYLESEEQQKLFRWWYQLKGAKIIPAHYMMYRNHNTQFATMAQQGRMKAEGSKPGIPDVFLAIPKDVYGGCYIEMKSPTHKPKRISSKGGLSDIQIVVIQDLKKSGYRVEVCYSALEAQNIVLDYLQLKL